MHFNLVSKSVCLFGCVAVVGGGYTLAAGPRIMALGDSITYGLTGTTGNYSDSPGGYRTNFFNIMNANGLDYKAVGSSTANPSAVLTANGQTAHNGYGGWTVANDVYSSMDNFTYHIDDWMQTSNPDEVLLLGGINDLLLGASVSHTTASMDALIGKIFTDKSNVTVFVSNLLPTTGGLAGTNSNVLAFNTALQNTIVPKYQNLGYNIYLVDQYSNFTSGGNPVGTNLPDGLHPNATGYDLMGATFANAVATYAPNAPARVTPIMIDIGGSGSGVNTKTTLGGNNIRFNSTWTNSLTDLTAEDGNATDYGFQWVSFNGIAYLNSIQAGTSLSGAAAAMFTDSAAKSYWGAPSGSSNKFIFKLTGLDKNLQYALDFFAGHEGGTDVTRFLIEGLTSTTGDLQSGSNLSNILAISGITPDANGVITVTVSAAPGSDSFFFNAMQLNEVPEPASLGLIAAGGALLLRRRKLA